MVTLRDIQRSINQTVRNATPDTDGQTTLDAIDTFLDEHGTTIDALSKNAASSTASSTGTSGGVTTAATGNGSGGTTTAATATTTTTTTTSSTTAAAAAATAVAVTTGIGSSSNTAINNEAIDRLSNDLFQLYNTIIISPPPSRNVSSIVSCSPEALLIHNQHYLILLFVRKLVPLLSPDRIFFHDWWPVVLKPVLKTASYTDKVRREARGIVSDCLILEKLLVANNNNKCTKMIVDEYLGWSENYHKREEDSLEILDKHQVATTTTPSSSFYGEQHQQDETTRLRLQHQALLDLEQDEWSKSLVAILLSFGAAETKRFFMLLNEYFLQSKHRLQIVYLLSEFLLRKRTHLHEILETELFTSMLKSMMYDNSTTLIAMSVTNLIMILPRICTSLPPHLPQLFYIFARALCWDQLRDIRKKQSRVSHNDQPSGAGESTPSSTSSSSPSSPAGNSRTAADGWDCADYTFSKLSAPPSNPLTGPFFTSLYGLYPCNFVRFLHAPYSYFVNNGFDMPEEFDEETFRSRTLTQVSRHMLHPSLVTMDTETELTDRSRWMKMEPPDVIAQIMSLDLTNAASRVAFSSDKQHRSGNQPDLLNESIWALTGQVPRPSSSSIEDQQQLEEQEESNSQQEQQEDTITTTTTTTTTIIDTVATKAPERKQQSSKGVNSILDMHRALKSGAEVLIGDDVWDADLERFSSPSPSASVSPLLPDPVSIAAMSITDASHLPETSIASPTPSTTTTISPETKLLIAALKREVLLLRNELNFELFVKQQHLQHMGRLHREHVVDSSVEAERQRTYNATRILRAQLKEANTALTKLKAESALTTQKHIKWEDEQGGKLRSYREARKKWQADMEEARQKLQEQEQLATEQRVQLLKSQQEVFELKNELKTRQPLLEKAAENEHRVMQLTKQMLLWEKDTAHLEEQKEYIKGLLSQWWGMEELVASLQAENQRLTKLQSELADEKEKISAQLEEQIKKESLLKKEVTNIDQNEKGVHPKQLQEMTQIIDELKQKIEDFQMEKLECRARIERTKHTATDKQKQEGQEETADNENENDDGDGGEDDNK